MSSIAITPFTGATPLGTDEQVAEARRRAGELVQKSIADGLPVEVKRRRRAAAASSKLAAVLGVDVPADPVKDLEELDLGIRERLAELLTTPAGRELVAAMQTPR